MKRDPKSFWRMTLAFFFAAVLAGISQLSANFIFLGEPAWRLVLQLAAGTGLITYIVASFHERGLLYSLIVSLAAAILITILAKIVTPWILQALLLFGFVVLLAGSMILGDLLGRPRLISRCLLGASFGTLASLVTAGITGALSPILGGFWKGITENLPIVFELGIIPSLALLLTRLILGKKQTGKVEEELE